MARETVVTYTCVRCKVFLSVSTAGAQLPDMSQFTGEGWTAHAIEGSFSYLDLCPDCSKAMERAMTATRSRFIAELEGLDSNG